MSLRRSNVEKLTVITVRSDFLQTLLALDVEHNIGDEGRRRRD